MAGDGRTGSTLPDQGTGRDWQKNGRSRSEAAQLTLNLSDIQDNQDKIADSYEVMRQAVRLYGGGVKLAVELGLEPDYEAHISKGLNRHKDRHAFVDWLIPLLQHPEAGALLVEWFCTLGGYKKPDRRPELSDADRVRALFEELRNSGAVGEDMIKRAAERAGVDVGSFRR